MTTLILQPHSLAHLLTTNRVLRLVPMEPQPPEPYTVLASETHPDGQRFWWHCDEYLEASWPEGGMKPPNPPGTVLPVSESQWIAHDERRWSEDGRYFFILTTWSGAESIPPVPPGQFLALGWALQPAAEMPAWAARHHARCESVVPLKLAELTEEQARETGSIPEVSSYAGKAEVHWLREFPTIPWNAAYAWAETWVIQQGDAK